MGEILANMLIKLLILMLATFEIASTNMTRSQICLSNDKNGNHDEIKCNDNNMGLFITYAEYSNDIFDKCNSSVVDKPVISSKLCTAYSTGQVGDMCNGKANCLIRMEQPKFKFGFDGSNCNFVASILTVSYQCIPVNFDNNQIAKFDICSTKTINSSLSGYIHTPNYPRNYNTAQLCETRININSQLQRLEIYIIDFELENLSIRFNKPTDYLDVNNIEKYYGKNVIQSIFNESDNVLLTFKSDSFFTKRGFFLFFQVINSSESIDLHEDYANEMDLIESTTPNSIHTSTIKTSTASITNETSIAFNQTNISSIATQSKLEIDKVVINQKNETIIQLTSPLSDRTKLMQSIIIIAGVFLIVLLSTIIIILYVSFRKRIYQEHMLYKASIQFESRYSDSSMMGINPELHVPGAYMMNVFNTKTNSNYNNIKHAYNNINNRIKNLNKNTSMDALLLNASLMSKTQSVANTSAINIKDDIKETRLVDNPNEQYEYIVDEKRQSKIEEEQLKIDNLNSVNEYCYLASSALVNEDKACKILTSEHVIISSSNECETNLRITPSLSKESLSKLITSTPTVPKTLPPVLHTKDDDVVKINSYTDNSSNCSSKENNDEENYHYQVPSNLPKTD